MASHNGPERSTVFPPLWQGTHAAVCSHLRLQSVFPGCLAHPHHRLRRLLLLSERTHFLCEGTNPRAYKQLYIQGNLAVHQQRQRKNIHFY